MIYRKIRIGASWLGQRSLIAYLLAFLMLALVGNWPLALKKARLRTIDRLRPASFRYLYSLSTGKEKPDPKKIDDYLHYYTEIASHMPHISEAFALSGFCYYYAGKKREAIKAYKRAVQVNPYFFWARYDLGVIYFEEKKYMWARTMLENAVRIPPKQSLTTLYAPQSLLYRNILAHLGLKKSSLQDALDRGYRSSYEMICRCFQALGNNNGLVKAAFLGIKEGMDNDGALFYYAGVAYYNMKDYKKAAFFLQKSLQKNPHRAQATRYLGMTAKKLGRSSLARRLLREAEILSIKTPTPSTPVYPVHIF